MADDAVEGLVDTSGSTPSVNWTQLASTFVGAIALGWFYGLIDLVSTVWTGISNGITRATIWVSDTLLTVLFAGILEGIGVSYTEAELWLENLGPAAPVGALLIIAVVTVIVIRSMQAAVRIVTGVI